MHFNGGTVKQTMVHLYHEVILNNKKKNLLLHVIAWINLQRILIKIKNPLQNVTYYMILEPHIICRYFLEIKNVTEMETRLVVANG